MRVLREVMRVVVASLQKGSLWGLLEQTRESVEWKGKLLLVSYCFHISGDKKMSAVQHLVAKKRLFARRMVTGEDIISNEMAGKRSIKNTKMVRSGISGNPRSNRGIVEDPMGKQKQRKEETVNSC